MEIPFDAEIILPGGKGLQVEIAAIAEPAGPGAELLSVIDEGIRIERQRSRARQIIVRWPRDHLRHCRAQDQIRLHFPRHIEARQKIRVALRFVHRTEDAPFTIVERDHQAVAVRALRRRGEGPAGTIYAIIILIIKCVGRRSGLLGVDDAQAQIAPQRIGLEVELGIAGPDLFADPVEILVLLHPNGVAIAAVEIVEIIVEIDAGKGTGGEAAGNIADGLVIEKFRQGHRAAGRVLIADFIFRIGIPFPATDPAGDLAVAPFDADLHGIDEAVKGPGKVELRIFLLDHAVGVAAAGRSHVDLRDAVHQILLQFGRKLHVDRTILERPVADEIAADILRRRGQAGLGRDAEAHGRTARRARLPDDERCLEPVMLIFAADVERVGGDLLAAILARQLRRFHGAGRFLRQASGPGGRDGEVGALQDGAALVESAAGEEVAIAPFGNLQHVGREVVLDLEAEIIGCQRQFVGRLPLRRRLDAQALALLVENGLAHRLGRPISRIASAVLRRGAGIFRPVADRAVIGIGIAIDIGRRLVGAIIGPPGPAFGPRRQGAVAPLLIGRADQNAKGLVRVPPAQLTGNLRLEFFRDIGIDALGRKKARPGVQIQRAPRLEDHRTPDAAFVEPRLGRFEHVHARDHVRRQQRIVEGAGRVAAVGRRDEIAVELRERQVRTQAADADARSFAAVPLDDDARYALQRIGDILVGEFADILGRDDVDEGVRLPLLPQALFDRLAIAGDDNVGWSGRTRIHPGRLLCSRRRILRLRGGNASHQAGRKHQAAQHLTAAPAQWTFLTKILHSDILPGLGRCSPFRSFAGRMRSGAPVAAL